MHRLNKLGRCHRSEGSWGPAHLPGTGTGTAGGEGERGCPERAEFRRRRLRRCEERTAWVTPNVPLSGFSRLVLTGRKKIIVCDWQSFSDWKNCGFFEFQDRWSRSLAEYLKNNLLEKRSMKKKNTIQVHHWVWGGNKKESDEKTDEVEDKTDLKKRTWK